ncbi:MAG: hypothetical protein ABIH26_06665 [Candidatus Eisenbacteria bacterium]
MKGLACDVALLPVSGVYVMTAEEAALAAGDLTAGLAIPMHHGSIAGGPSDAKRFADLCPIPAVVLETASRGSFHG